MMRNKTLEEIRLDSLAIRSDLSSADLFRLKNLQLGREGEDQAYHFIKRYGSRHWQLLADVSFDWHAYPYQVDLILLAGEQAFVIEVKNYQADIDVRHTDVFYGDKELIHNPCAQLKKNYLAFQEYCQFHNIHLNWDCFLFFVHPDYSCRIQNCPLKVFGRPQLRQFLDQLQSKTDPSNQQSQNVADWIASIESKIHFTPTSTRPSLIKKGIYCRYCQSFDLEMSKFNIYCQKCAKVVNKVDALRELIDEWCALNYDQPIQSRSIVDFSAGAFKINYVNHFLKANLERENTGYYARYKNPYSYDFIMKQQ